MISGVSKSAEILIYKPPRSIILHVDMCRILMTLHVQKKSGKYGSLKKLFTSKVYQNVNFDTFWSSFVCSAVWSFYNKKKLI